jgi:hypothetical protein
MTEELRPTATEPEQMEYPVIELTVAERGVRSQLGDRISSPASLLLYSDSYLLTPNF